MIAQQNAAPSRSEVDWWARASAVAGELRSTAVERERANKAPRAEIDRLRDEGLLAVLHPRSLGGGGLAWPEALRLVRRIAQGDASIGQLLGYHFINSQVPFLSAARDAEALGRDTVERRLYWGAAVNPRDSALSLTRDGTSFRLNGRKTFSTGARVADRLNVLARLDDKVVHLVAASDRAGFEAADDWDAIGQRLSDSGSITFSDYPVTEGDFLFPPAPLSQVPLPSATLNTPLIQLVFTNIYLGTAEEALAQAGHYVRTVTKPWEHSGVSAASDDPYILERFGEFTASLSAATVLAEQAGSVLQQAVERGSDLTASERGEAAIPAYQAKIVSTHVSLEITSHIFELMGARATAARYGFDRFWRNVRTHTLHDPVAYKARDVGAHALNGRLPVADLYS